MNHKNCTQYLGQPPYTPMYMYLRKNPKTGQLAEIRTFNTTPRDPNFIKAIARIAKMDP